MEVRGLAASTLTRRLSTVCGFYRFAHIDGRIAANPAQYVRSPKVAQARDAAWTAESSARFSSPLSVSIATNAALAVLLGLNGLRVSEACATSIEDLGFQGGHRSLRIIGKGNKPALIPLVPARPARSTRRSANATRVRSFAAGTGSALIAVPPIAGSTTIYDRRRVNFDNRHAAYVVVAFVAGG
jgi:site-specific recombinase XerC